MRGARPKTPAPRRGDGDSFLVYSRPATPKLRAIERNPRVALHLDGNGRGGDIVIVTGSAQLSEADPPADEVPEYLEKYAETIAGIGWTPASFAADYSVPLRVRGDAVRGH